MKKIMASLLSVILMLGCLFSVASAAELNEFELNELDMKLTIPDNFSVITRDSAEDDEAHTLFSSNYTNLMQIFTNSGIYLQAITADRTLTVTVTMNEDENSKSLASYNSLSNKELETLKSSFIQNEIYTSAEAVKINKQNYIKLIFEQTVDDGRVYGIQFNTVENGRNINITMASTAAAISAQNTDAMNNIIESIAFTAEKNIISSFSLPTAILLILLILAVCAAIIIIIRLILKNKKTKIAIASNAQITGGFDTPQISLTYKISEKRQAKQKLKEEELARLKEKKRREIVEKIENGNDYDIFNEK